MIAIALNTTLKPKPEISIELLVDGNKLLTTEDIVDMEDSTPIYDNRNIKKLR